MSQHYLICQIVRFVISATRSKVDKKKKNVMTLMKV